MCRNGLFASDQAPFGLAKVTGAGRVPFLGDMDACPNETPACKGTGYLVAGDEVITGKARGPYVCVFYPNKGGGSAGWVGANRLVRERVVGPPLLTAWAGQWSYGDDSIRLKARGSELVADGDAFWPSANPPLSVRPGGPNIGQFSGKAHPEGGHVVFKDGTGEYACVVTLDLVGRYLIASDNSNCGGMNVRFDGVYRRG